MNTHYNISYKPFSSSYIQMRFLRYGIVYVLFFTLYTCNVSGQSVANINIPHNPGWMPEDITFADGKLFLYSTSGIAVYNASSGNLLHQTNFFQGGTIGQPYMALHSLIDNRTAYNTLAFDGSNTVYAIAPDYSVRAISTSNYNMTTVINPVYSNEFFHGSAILKYEPNTKWLFYAAQGSPGNYTDDLKQFFGIYDTDDNFNVVHYSYQNPSDSPDIYDLLIDYKENGYGFFYLSRKGKIQIYGFETQTPSVNLQFTKNTPENKHGKLITVKGHPQVLNKIICLPLENRNSNMAKLYVFDGNDPLNTNLHQEIHRGNLPASKIPDAIFDNLTNKLIFAVKPDEVDNPDIWIYQVSINNQLMALQETQSIYSNCLFPNDTSNFPIHTHPVDQSQFLVSKKNQYGFLSYDQGSGNYNWSSDNTQVMSGNYFERVIYTSNKLYILRLAGGGFTMKPPLSLPIHINTGNHVNKGFFSAYNDLVFSYSDEGIYPNELFITNSLNYSTTTQSIGFQTGDILLNPSANQVIASKYQNSDCHIRVFQANEGLTVIGDYYSDKSTPYWGKMFIDPKEYLYVLSGMKAGSELKMNIFNLKNLSQGGQEYSLGQIFPPSASHNSAPSELTARFFYHPLDQLFPVYFYITNSTTPKINTSASGRATYLFKINHKGEFHLIDYNESLCYDFVISNQGTIYLALDNSLKVIQGQNTSFINKAYIDLQRDPQTGKIYALSRNQGSVQLIDSLDKANNQSQTLLQLNHYVSNISLIDELRHLVAFSPINLDASLPDDNVKLYFIDLMDNYTFETISLNLKSLNRFNLFNKLEFDIIYDDVNKKLLIPQGGQSKISVVENLPGEVITLQPRTWNWISFPRLDRQGNDPVPSQPLLEGIVEFPSYLQLLHKVPISQNEISKTFDDEFGWSGNLDDVQSTLGYKLETDNAGVSFLPMSGTILPPDSTLPLYAGKANWTGYFLTRTQSPFDAIGSEFLDKFTSMAGQHWFCYNQASPAPTPKNSGSQWRCACNQGRIEIRYTDMIVIRPFENISNFHWQYAGQPLMDDPKEATLFYSFEEKADYEAIFIELDTLNTPAEIGAFAGDSCIGATTVLPADSLVLICAYTEGFEGQEISFEMLYPGKSSRPRHEDYLVTNPKTGIREKRRIVAGGNQPYHVVSFKTEPAQSLLSGSFHLQCIPNPANRQVTVSYFLARDAVVSLQLTNALGVAVMSWKPGLQSAGSYTFGISAEALPAGFYQLGISDGTIYNTEKLLIIH